MKRFKTKIALTICLTLAAPNQQLRGYSFDTAARGTLMTTGALTLLAGCGVLACKALETPYLLWIFHKNKQRFLEEKKKLAPSLLPKPIQKIARIVYEELKKERKWYDIKGKIIDRINIKYGMIQVYQGGEKQKYFDENPNLAGCADLFGIYLPQGSISPENREISDFQRQILRHELLHQYRGDYCERENPLRNAFASLFLFFFKSDDVIEFHTEKANVISSYKNRDLLGLNETIKSRLAEFYDNPQNWSPYTFGALDGIAEIFQMKSAHDPEKYVGNMSFYEGFIQGCLDGNLENLNHPEDCKCYTCAAIEAVRNWGKPKGYKATKKWHAQFVEKLKKEHCPPPEDSRTSDQGNLGT